MMLIQKLERWRLGLHFKTVIAILRQQDVNHLAPEQRQQRDNQLNQLEHYAESGIFPRNYEKLPYSPCFIDRDGHECAVAHLLIQSGEEALADKVVNVANYATVPEMHFPELNDWAEKSGLSKEELALIQPGYPMEFNGFFLVTAIISWVIGAISIFASYVHLRWVKRGKALPTLALTLAFFVLLVSCGLFTFWLADMSYKNSMDVPNYIIERALEYAQGFLYSGLITVSIALIAIACSVYAWQVSEPITQKPKRKRWGMRWYKTLRHNQQIRQEKKENQTD